MSENGSNSSPALLVVDDEPAVLALVPQLFLDQFPVLRARNGEEALGLLGTQEVGVVIADQRMPGMAGNELLARIAAERPDIVRILLTAYVDTENMLKAINDGQVYQFITKPWENRELAAVVHRAMETYRLRMHNSHLLSENVRLVAELKAANAKLETENRALRREVSERYRLGSLIGTSPAMREVFRLLDKASHASTTVLLSGETGTGKELAAGCIHYNSARRGRKFVPLNCGSLPEGLLESELFGHVRGAFTGALRDRRGLFEDANGGTIFLDEIGEMSPTMQVKVLRVVEDGLVRPLGGTDAVRVDVRLVCATNRDLKAEVETGAFRRDLFYRLNVFPIVLPPLRTRAGDVPLLAQHFFHTYNATSSKRLQGLTPAAMKCLERYPWPGNVRELKNEIERAVTLADPEEALDLRHFSADVSGEMLLNETQTVNGKLRERLDRLEQILILQELRLHKENRTQTARKLGISVRALQKKMGKYGLREPAE